ncbi:TPA: hypothetical protein N0F65_012688 [Lagenidium giganteum]|uniref:Uncharacterized protein n=1 Tax=Lagenidium giganteum TaxID=4803 RepID=A0AAV2YLB2_9STRA|nr:TPA: hypothetical protein N0F65_012688 [Lagenidium giganteum]
MDTNFPIQLLYNDIFFARLATESQMIATGTLLGLFNEVDSLDVVSDIAILNTSEYLVDEAITATIVVLVIHIAAHFATKYPCLVYTYGCDALNDTTAQHGHLNFSLTLNFAHCSELCRAQRHPALHQPAWNQHDALNAGELVKGGCVDPIALSFDALYRVFSCPLVLHS